MKAINIKLIFIISVLVMGLIHVNSSIPTTNDETSSQNYIISQISLLDDGETGTARNMEIIPGTDTMAVADGNAGLLLINISTPDNLEIISSYSNYSWDGDFAADVDVINSNRIILYTNIGNLFSINIQDPQNLVTEQGYSWWGGSSLNNIVKLQSAVGNLIYSIEPDYEHNGDYTFNSYDFTSSNYQRTIYGGEGGQFSEPNGMVIDGDYAYISNSTTLHKFDITNGGFDLVANISGLEFPPLDIYSPTLNLIEFNQSKYIISTNGMVFNITGDMPELITQVAFGVSNIRDILLSEGELMVTGTDYFATFDLLTFNQTQRIGVATTFYDYVFNQIMYLSTDDGVMSVKVIEGSLEDTSETTESSTTSKSEEDLEDTNSSNSLVTVETDSTEITPQLNLNFPILLTSLPLFIIVVLRRRMN